ncbi:MAG TPA: WG repeat-containing protein, partial [Nitrospinota bacterium]|nr:WG repeat-containing protein [Nitrospinota bacterium]
GLAAVYLKEKQKWGYIDKTGKIVIKPEFYRVWPFSDGLAAVYVKEKEKWGYIDKTGKVVIEPKFDWASRFSEGLARVGVGKKFRNIKSFKLDLSSNFPKNDRNKS